MNRIGLIALLVLTLMTGTGGTARANGPGSTADAREAYEFFYAQLQNVYFTNGNGDRVLKATSVAAEIATAGRGAAQDAIAAFNFFYAQLQGVYFTNGNGDRVLKAMDYAVQVGKAGRGASKETQDAYTVF